LEVDVPITIDEADRMVSCFLPDSLLDDPQGLEEGSPDWDHQDNDTFL